MFTEAQLLVGIQRMCTYLKVSNNLLIACIGFSLRVIKLCRFLLRILSAGPIWNRPKEQKSL
jgi:hypothetical protein